MATAKKRAAVYFDPVLHTALKLKAFGTRRSIFDEPVKSRKSRHSRESGSPQRLEKTGFPPSRE